MSNFIRMAIVGAALSVAAPAFGDGHGTIVDQAQATEDLSTLVTAVSTAGLVETLSGEGPFTVFAPTNAAFDALPDGTLDSLLADTETLTSVLTYHVVSGEVMAEALVSAIGEADGNFEVATVQGGTLTASLDGENVTLTDAQGNAVTVVATDVDASNGVVHVIDGVLLP